MPLHVEYWRIWLIFTIFAILGCQISEKKAMTDEEIQSDIEILIDAMALPNPRIIPICERLIEHRERAISELDKNIENRFEVVRCGCIYCLGEIYSKTKSPEILKLKPKFVQRFQYDPSVKVRMEAASTLCHLGDYRGVPLFLEGLRHEEIYVRWQSLQTLRSISGIFGTYDHKALPEQRNLQAKTWEQWWEGNRDKYLNSAEKTQ